MSEYELPAELTLIAKHWPEQVVPDYMPYAIAWRNQFPGEAGATRARCMRLLRDWSKVANGRNLDPKLIMEWNLQLGKSSRNGTTLGRCNGILRSFLRWLRSVGVIQMDPSLALAKFPSAQSRQMEVFTHAEYERIVAHGEANPERFAIATWLVVLAYHTGFSLVDCCRLKWDEVNIDPTGPCYIRHVRIKMRSRTGSKATCTVPIVVGGELWNWIIRLSKAHQASSEWVHPEAISFYNDRALEPKRIFRRLFNESLGWKTRRARTFRCLRNTFCSRLLNAGVDPIVVSKMTGHSRLDQLATYVTPNIRVMQDAIKRGLDYVQTPGEPITIPLNPSLDHLSGNPAGQ